MHKFQVWAPIPKKVELLLGNEKLPMTAGAGGWWEATVPAAAPGADYAFLLDGQGPFPDPRSPWQPAGVHRHSRLLDHRAFQWTDGGYQAPPLGSAVIYELHTGTFTPQGTFAAAINKLDHLLQLGVTHIELMPVAAFPGARGWGYDGVSLFAPQGAYGEPSDLKRLVDACHARGLAVLLDVVYNHLGPSGNYLARFGPYFTARYSTPWGAAVNYDDAESDEVRRFFCDNALMWLRDYHFDGLRLDAIHAIIDISALPFLEQLAAEVKQLQARLSRRVVLIAESDLNAPRVVLPPDRGGYGLDAQWSDDFHHALHAVLTGETNGYYADFGSLANLAKALRQAFVRDGSYSIHRRCRLGRPPVGLSGERFLACLQNHDQIGNRAQGERSSQLMSLGRLKIGAALVLTSPFVPLLFQGEEWGAHTPFLYFADHQEPELAQAVREGRRREFAAFGWKPEDIPDPGLPDTFQRSKLDWSEILREPHRGLLHWHRQLIHLRRAQPELFAGPLEGLSVRFDEQARWLALARGHISVACNFGSGPQVVPLSSGPYQTLLASDPSVEIGLSAVTLAPDSVVILKN
jgi:maltooligosyltrehalose trehalohydrolase